MQTLHSGPGPGFGRARAVEAAAAFLLAILLAGLVDSFTGIMPPKWDPTVYTDMALHGVLDNDHLVAPFAYRPAVPLLAGALSRAFAVPVDAAFLWITRCAVVCLLFFTFLLARRFAGSGIRASIPVFFVAASVIPVKFVLFVPASVDAAAYPLMVLAFWAYARGSIAASFWISAVGLFFKEFLAIPLLLAIGNYARAWRGERTRRALWIFGGSVAVALAVVLIPRLGLPVIASRQEIDPVNNLRSLSRLVANPLNMARNLNIVLCLLAFWLPVLLLLTRERARSVAADLAPLRNYIAVFLALDLLLAMYGGSNLLTFVSYGIPVQILVLARLASAGSGGASDRPRPFEWLLALACTVSYNRVFGTIPFPEDGFDAYVDYYSGWAARVNLSTLARFGEIALYLVLAHGARRLLRARA